MGSATAVNCWAGGQDTLTNITILNALAAGRTDISGWTWVRGTGGLTGDNIIHSTNSAAGWFEQTIDFNAEQLARIPNGDCQLDGEFEMSSFSADSDNGAIFIVYRDASDVPVGFWLRPFDDYDTAGEIIPIVDWIPVAATKFTIQFLGSRNTGTENSVYFGSVELDFIVHATRKHEYLYANQSTDDDASWTIDAGNPATVTTFGLFDYPGITGSSSSLDQRQRNFVPSAEAMTQVAAGNATIYLRAYMFNENADDRCRVIARQYDAGAVLLSALENSSATVDYGTRGNVFSGSQAVNTALSYITLFYVIQRFDGTFNDGVISNYACLVEYDKVP